MKKPSGDFSFIYSLSLFFVGVCLTFCSGCFFCVCIFDSRTRLGAIKDDLGDSCGFGMIYLKGFGSSGRMLVCMPELSLTRSSVSAYVFLVSFGSFVLLKNFCYGACALPWFGDFHALTAQVTCTMFCKQYKKKTQISPCSISESRSLRCY